MKYVDGKHVITTYYSYKKPVKGDAKGLNSNNFTPVNSEKETIVAIAHTHGRHSDQYDDEKFSSGDIDTTIDKGLTRMYLATPGGYLIVLDLESTAKAKKLPMFLSIIKVQTRQNGEFSEE